MTRREKVRVANTTRGGERVWSVRNHRLIMFEVLSRRWRAMTR
ncbi:MAG: hypothetical protein ACYDB2_02780 [Acidimicrobiales bacterium]